jgi:hypothetical protein
LRRRSPVYAPVAKLVYAMDLGDVTSVKIFLAYNHIT